MNDPQSPTRCRPSPWAGCAPPRRRASRWAAAATRLPTDEVLRFGWAHAQARDAVHAAARRRRAGGRPARRRAGTSCRCTAARADRATYLRRPDLGRRSMPTTPSALHGHAPTAGGCDVCIVIGDGLSSLAVAAPRRAAARGPARAPARRHRAARRWSIATQARVALGDDIGERLGARLSVMLIGERPGLSSPDSLGIYLTYAPRRGRHDAERNCISNVRPEGLPLRGRGAQAGLAGARRRCGAG